MNILYVTANSHLRSTTSSLDAIFTTLGPQGVLRPVMVFREPGPWQSSLALSGVSCYFDPLDVPEVSAPWPAVRACWNLRRIIRRHAIDVIHCNEHELFPLVRVVARLTGKPVVLSVHFPIEAPMSRWMFRPPYRPAMIQCVSQAVLDDTWPGLDGLVDRDSARVVPNSLSVEGFRSRAQGSEAIRTKLGIPRDAIVLGSASALRARKRLEDFIDLVDGLRGAGERVFGIIAGGAPFTDPDYEAALVRRVQERRLEESVRFVGNVDPLAPWLEMFDIFVSTSELEPFGMSALEAMCCGTPTVAYAAGGIADVVGDRRCLVPTGDTSALLACVRRLLADPALREDVGAAATRWARDHFDATVVAPMQVGIYETVMARHRPAVLHA